LIYLVDKININLQPVNLFVQAIEKPWEYRLGSTAERSSIVL